MLADTACVARLLPTSALPARAVARGLRHGIHRVFEFLGPCDDLSRARFNEGQRGLDSRASLMDPHGALPAQFVEQFEGSPGVGGILHVNDHGGAMRLKGEGRSLISGNHRDYFLLMRRKIGDRSRTGFEPDDFHRDSSIGRSAKNFRNYFLAKTNCALMLSAGDADKPAENIPGARHSFR